MIIVHVCVYIVYDYYMIYACVICVSSDILVCVLCPTDTTMMFVLVTLGLYKLYECRNPDKYSRPHKLLLVLALMILFIGMGVVSN